MILCHGDIISFCKEVGRAQKKQALPTPKAKLYTEDAALLVPIFQKEPFITFQELQAKYGDILTDQQIYRGLLGTFAPTSASAGRKPFRSSFYRPSRPRCNWRSFPTRSAAV